MSGKEAGIYALARIECDPTHLREYEPERKYWLGDNEGDLEIRVRLTIINNLINKTIFKSKLLNLNGLASLFIFRQFQGTNFPVKDSERKISNQLLYLIYFRNYLGCFSNILVV